MASDVGFEQLSTRRHPTELRALVGVGDITSHLERMGECEQVARGLLSISPQGLPSGGAGAQAEGASGSPVLLGTGVR